MPGEIDFRARNPGGENGRAQAPATPMRTVSDRRDATERRDHGIVRGVAGVSALLISR